MKWLVASALAQNLFPFDRGLTRGEQLYFRTFEAFIGLCSLQIAWQWAAYIQRIKQVIRPQGVAYYIDISWLYNNAMSYVLFGVLALSLLIAVTCRLTYAYGAALLIMHLLYIARHSLGKTSHVAHCIGMALIALALGTALFRSSAAHLQRFVVGFMVFFSGLGYTLAALCKLVYTGPSWPAGAHLALWIKECAMDGTSSFGEFQMNTVQRLVVENPTLGTLALAFGWAAEFMALLACFERIRPWILTWLILMHLGIGMTMNIHFPFNIMVLVMLAYPWGRAIDWLLPRASIALRKAQQP